MRPLALFLISLVLAGVSLWIIATAELFRPIAPIRIGVLHSLSGTLALHEKQLVDAVTMAVEEINASGGLLGRPLEIVLSDGASDDRRFAAEAERLISQDQVSVLFACWTSACRNTVKPVVERHNSLMFYSVQYEGLEHSPNIFYTGSVPNQQIIPGARWALDRFGKRVYLLGSDYVYPRIAGRIIRDIVQAAGGEVLVERYRPLGERNFDDIVDELRRIKPDVVFNNINGDSNLDFFGALHRAGLQSQAVVSFSLAEVGMQQIGKAYYHPNNYAVWSYFQSLPGVANQRFVNAFHQRFGSERVTTDPVVASYNGMHLWAKAVLDAKTDHAEQVRRALTHMSLDGPSGIVSIDRATQHTWKPVYVGRAQTSGQFDIVWGIKEPLCPRPFPDYHTMPEWERLKNEVSKLP